jgi:hypothetical protein
MLALLLENLAEWGLPVVIYDNGHESTEGRELLAQQPYVVDAHGWPFYRMWNDAWQQSAEAGYDAVALLNDDIVLHPESLAIAYKRLMASNSMGIIGLNYDRPVANGARPLAKTKLVSGSYRNFGIGGHAFIVRSSTWGIVPPIDEEYVIWYGDDELFANMELAGYKLGIAIGAPVDHQASTTLNQYPELLAQREADAERFFQRFG